MFITKLFKRAFKRSVAKIFATVSVLLLGFLLSFWGHFTTRGAPGSKNLGNKSLENSLGTCVKTRD